MINKFYKKVNYNIDIHNLIKVSNNKKCIYTLTEKILFDYAIINKIDFKNIQKDYSRLMFQLNIDLKNITISNLIKLLGRKNKNIYLINLKNLINNCNMNINDYYFGLLQKRTLLTDAITSFDNLPMPVYDHLTHKTGRVKISKGTNFLTIRKDTKNNLKPKKGNILIEIDLKSAEPNFLYHMIYGKSEENIYSIKNIDRSKAKIAILSLLYGAADSSIQKKANLSLADIKRIKKIFCISEVKENLRTLKKENNCLISAYGRHIPNDKNIINYWLQSSTADFALSCFFEFYKSYNIDVKAIIHDAILFECTETEYNRIKKINYLFDPISKFKLPIDKRIITK